ncbi:MAG TPA: HAD-IC family P-type ATPase, partial [Pyrinomonadaceae bacterium]|nr:HAD-IC family P-type ATPase [Pyrinomonadaceae bacterium]
QSLTAAPGYLGQDVLRLAASLEKNSEHPLAGAIIARANEYGISLLDLSDFKSVTGQGVQGIIDGQLVQVGNLAAPSTETKDVLTEDFLDTITGRQSEGETIVFVAAEGRLVGYLGIADAIKPSAELAINELHRRGIEVIMMTGDNELTASAVATELNIDQVFAEVMPEDKAAKVKELQSQGKIVAMAGDGVNDAPALAQADVGIAFASGTDVAIESADITLLKPDLNGILKARNLSKATMRNIRQNLFFAFIYNVVGVPVAAGVLFPILGLLLSPMIASAAMTFSSVSVIANALRLRNLEL